MPHTILVVDDEPLKRITLRIELIEAGYVVFEAADAVAAIQILESRPIDAVVSDVRMPGMNGLDLLAHVKRVRPATHVILMTAYATIGMAVQAIKQGAHDYITKPFSTPELIAKLAPLFSESGVANETPIASAATELDALPTFESSEDAPFVLADTVAEIERRLIQAALRQCAGNQARAAAKLGIPRTTLRDKMAKYTIATEA